ncbi:MAG: hypothetical protein EB060_08190 [Proteobacteria bacterium]|nr:hypothetical protein [Pseudomonadota bacterium]
MVHSTDPYDRFKEIAKADVTDLQDALRRDIAFAGKHSDKNHLELVRAYEQFIDGHAEDLYFLAAADGNHAREIKPMLRAMAKFITQGPYRLSKDEVSLLKDPSRILDKVADRFGDDEWFDMESRAHDLRDRADEWLDTLWSKAMGASAARKSGRPESFEDFMERPEAEAALRMHRDSIFADIFRNADYQPPERKPWQTAEQHYDERWRTKLGYEPAKDDPYAKAAHFASKFLLRYSKELQSHETGLDDYRMLRFGLQRLSMGGSFAQRVKDSLDQGELILRRANMHHAADFFAEHIRPCWREIRHQQNIDRGMI